MDYVTFNEIGREDVPEKFRFLYDFLYSIHEQLSPTEIDRLLPSISSGEYELFLADIVSVIRMSKISISEDQYIFLKENLEKYKEDMEKMGFNKVDASIIKPCVKS